MLDGKTNHRV
jgi:hypothetical protein